MDVAKAFESRLHIYRRKRDEADPFANATYTRREAYILVVEAIELLALEAGIKLESNEYEAEHGTNP